MNGWRHMQDAKKYSKFFKSYTTRKGHNGIIFCTALREMISLKGHRIFTIPIIFLVLCLSLPNVVSASTISLSPPSIILQEGDTSEIALTIDNLPKGLAGYTLIVELSNHDVADITKASFPEWASLSNVTRLSSNLIRLSAVDMKLEVNPGSTEILLGTITIKGQKSGFTTLNLKDVQIDADGGDLVTTTANSGSLTVIGASNTNGKYDGSNAIQESDFDTMSPKTTSVSNVESQNANTVEIAGNTDQVNIQLAATESNDISETPVEAQPTKLDCIPSLSLPSSLWVTITAIMISLGGIGLYLSNTRKR